MIEACIYGDEELDENGKDLVEKIKRMSAQKFIDQTLKLTAEDAADIFIGLVGSLDYLWTGNDVDYFKNVAAILFKLAEKPGFYEAFLSCREKLEGDELPSRASLVVYSQ